MTQEEFLRELSECLQGEIDDREYQDSMNYYRTYIADEIMSGKNEEEIIDMLGSPRLIAKSIIEASANAAPKASSDDSKAYDYQEEDSTSQYRRSESSSMRWFRQLGRILITVGIILIILIILSGAIQLFFPIICVILFVQIIRSLSNRR